jgi:hypothetical protein
VPDVDKYEILVLGSGEAGKYLAWTMAKEGRGTALVERRWLGGSQQFLGRCSSSSMRSSRAAAPGFTLQPASSPGSYGLRRSTDRGIHVIFFGTENLAAQVMMTGILSVIVFMGLLVIVSIDHPFIGPVHVGSEPLQTVVEDFEPKLREWLNPI